MDAARANSWWVLPFLLVRVGGIAIGTQRSFPTTGLVGQTWKLKLDVGREKGSWMPEEWATSGARLQLDATVTFDDEPISEDETLVGPAGLTRRLSVCSPSRFIDREGEQKVKWADGGWQIQVRGLPHEAFHAVHVLTKILASAPAR